MSETRICPVCNTPIPAQTPGGMCPKCMLQAGLQNPSGPVPTQTSPAAPGGFVPLAPAELAEKLPQFEVLELLGRGGMGAVYKARQKELDRLVAIKILPAEIAREAAFADRFTREARALARLHHTHIVTVFDFGQVDGLYYFVMEYVEGVNLRQALKAGMTAKEALAIVPQISDALQFAHDQGIVHRDIKPENILLDRHGKVKIADFGLSKIVGEAAGDASLTATHQVMGTLRYMAPEQMEGSREVDHRADIYSLGVVFYELLTGELPLGRFAPPSQKVHIDVRLDEVVLRALAKEPEQRYQNASEVRVEVEAIQSRGPAAHLPKPDAAAEVALSANEHPFLKGLRFFMTPQPGYGVWVGLPTGILTGLIVLGSVLGALVIPPENEAAQLSWLCGSMALLGVIFATLHALWQVFGRTTGDQASPRQPRLVPPNSSTSADPK